MDKPRLNLRLCLDAESHAEGKEGGRKKKVKQTVQRVGRGTLTQTETSRNEEGRAPRQGRCGNWCCQAPVERVLSTVLWPLGETAQTGAWGSGITSHLQTDSGLTTVARTNGREKQIQAKGWTSGGQRQRGTQKM